MRLLLLASLIYLCPFTTAGVLHAQLDYMHLSPLQKIEQVVGQSKITVEYSRPHLRGRKIFGALEPWDKKWRTGANRNTKITFSDAVWIGDTRVPAGTYALLTTPNPQRWTVYFYKDLSHWEVPDPWDEKQVAATVQVKPVATERTVQRLTFTLDDMTDDDLNLTLSWENTRLPIPIKLTTAEIIKKVLAGPSADDYHRAALYRLTWGGDYAEALPWADAAIRLRPKKEYWDQNLKAKLLAKLGRYPEAIAAAEKGLALAKARPSPFGVDEAEMLLEAYRAEGER